MVLARHHQPRMFVHLGAVFLTLHSQVADQGRGLGELAIRGWMQGVAAGVSGGDWFGRAQGLDLLARVASAQFGVGGNGQATEIGSGALPFLPGGHGLGEGLLALVIVVAQGAVGRGQVLVPGDAVVVAGLAGGVSFGVGADNAAGGVEGAEPDRRNSLPTWRGAQAVWAA